MKLKRINDKEWQVEVFNAPHFSRIFKTRYAALVYIRRLENGGNK